MLISAMMPIKLNNERLPGKNTMLLGKKPLIQYQLNALLESNLCDTVSVFCSNTSILSFLPADIRFIQRLPELDLPTSNFTQIFDSFMKQVDSDIYVYAHATAPFITVDTIKSCISAVTSGKYDSAFCAVKIQDFLWSNGQALNFNPANIPRSQDLTPIYKETSGIYVFQKDVFLKYKRRIGFSPYICEISVREAVDINTLEDFKLAEALLNTNL